MLTSEDARRIASELAAREGWPFREPLQVTCRRAMLLGPQRWTVLSNAQGRGSNVRVVIDARTGAIVSQAWNPR